MGLGAALAGKGPNAVHDMGGKGLVASTTRKWTPSLSLKLNDAVQIIRDSISILKLGTSHGSSEYGVKTLSSCHQTYQEKAHYSSTPKEHCMHNLLEEGVYHAYEAEYVR